MKKPMFKPLSIWLRGADGNFYLTRATDAREMTPEKAVEKVLQSLFNDGVSTELLFEAAKSAGMGADVTTESRVRVRMAKK